MFSFCALIFDYIQRGTVVGILLNFRHANPLITLRADQTNRLVRGQKTFATRLTVQHLNTGFLDDIPTGDLVTASGNHSIAGAVFPNGLWVQEMTLQAGGTIGGVDLSQAVLLGTTAVLGELRDFKF